MIANLTGFAGDQVISLIVARSSRLSDVKIRPQWALTLQLQAQRRGVNQRRATERDPINQLLTASI